MTCMDYDSGWTDERSVEVDRHKISQVLRTLIICSFKATQAGGNIHITVSLVEHTPPPPPPLASALTIRGFGLAGRQNRKSSMKSLSKEKAAPQPAADNLAGGGAGGGHGGRRAGSDEKKSQSDGNGNDNRINEPSRRRMVSNEWLVLEVIDNGKALHRREVDGSLLRLRACSKMVEVHGGSMNVHPRPNGKAGAIFQVKLPCFKLQISKGQRENSQTAANILGRAARVDSSGGSSDHGCFGMRNEFAGFDNNRGGAESQLDWFVPDNAFDLNAPSSNRDPSMHVLRDDVSIHSTGSKNKGGGNILGNLMQLSGAHSRNSTSSKVGGRGGRQRGRSSRAGMSSVAEVSMRGRSSRPPSDCIQYQSTKMDMTNAANPKDAAAAGGGGTGGNTGATAKSGVTSAEPQPTIMGSVMDLLGQLGQSSMMSNVSNVMQQRLSSSKGLRNQGSQSSRGDGYGSPGHVSRHSRNSRNSLAGDGDDDARAHDAKDADNTSGNVQTPAQRQLLSQDSASERRIPLSGRNSEVERLSTSMLKSPSVRAVNSSAKASSNSSQPANKFPPRLTET